MSATERQDPMCDVFARLIIRSEWLRSLRASARRSSSEARPFPLTESWRTRCRDRSPRARARGCGCRRCRGRPASRPARWGCRARRTRRSRQPHLAGRDAGRPRHLRHPQPRARARGLRSLHRVRQDSVRGNGRASDEDLRALARKLRSHSLRMISLAKTSHIGSCLSVADILAVLYGRIMRIDPKRPTWPDRDRLIMSKGHAAAVTYAAVAEAGFIPEERLSEYAHNGGQLYGHVACG